MEENIISTDNLPSDIINITFEFIQPGSDEASENGAGQVILERTGDQFVEVIHCPSGSPDDPAVPVQISSTNDINCSNRECGTQESLHSVVVQGNCEAERKTSEKTLSNSSQMSVSNPWQLSIVNPPHSLISNSQQQLISNTQQRPSMINLRIQNGQVVERVYVKTPVQTQALQKKKMSTTRPKRARKTANNKNMEDAANEKEIGGTSNNEKVDDTPANNTLEGTQITNSTKLALQNFLKKKSMAKVNDKMNGKSVDDNADGSVSNTGEFEVSNGCDKDRAHSHQLSNIEKDGINVSAGTESQMVPEVASIAESGSQNPVQSSANSDSSPNKSTSTAVQNDNDNDQPSNEQSDVTGLNVDSTDKEINQDGDDSTCTSDGASSSQITITQEVDVVVLPSLLQPNVSKNMAKTRAEKVPQQQTGIKKKKAKKHRVCAECGKTLTSHQYYEHMNIHYDRRPHKCTECGKAFRQSHHLAKHKLLHTGEKPFACQYCDRAFTSYYNRQDHERIHTGEKPYKCTHCGKMFRTTNMVKAHERNFHNLYVKSNLRSKSYVKSGTTMNEKRIYTCKICDKTFSWSSALSVHKKSHADSCTYKCNKCSKAFKNNSSLWNHKRTHSKEKPFECDLCGQRLKRRGNLKRHILTQHEPEEAEQCLKTSKQFENFRAKKKIENK